MSISRAEREKYYKHGLKAKQHPEKYLSLIIDGMDQSKHNLPHFNVTTKVKKDKHSCDQLTAGEYLKLIGRPQVSYIKTGAKC